MPDQDIIDYIRENKARYGIDALKRGLLDQGVSAEEIREAIEFVEEQETEKISEFLKEAESEIEDIEEEIEREIEEDILDISSSSKKKEYIEKADKVIGVMTDVLGVARRDKKVYVDSVKYGALAFLFLNIIVIMARYLGGLLIIGGLKNQFGTSWTLHFPNAFWSSIKLFDFDIFENPSLIMSSIWALLIGGIATLLFIRFLTNVWPFSIWPKLSQKIFYFYLIFNLIFGFIFAFSFAEFSFRHFLGYILVLGGMVGGSYLASNYFNSVMESRHGEKMRSIALKID